MDTPKVLSWFYTLFYDIVLIFLVAQKVKNLTAVWEMQVRSLDWKDPLEKGMATHSSILFFFLIFYFFLNFKIFNSDMRSQT